MWMKLYDSTPLKTQPSDKYRVREWIREKKRKMSFYDLECNLKEQNEIYGSMINFPSKSPIPQKNRK